MNDEQGPAKASLEDLKRGALEHYEHVSTVAHHWSSFIPKAIEAYQEWISVGEQMPEFGKKVLVWYYPIHPIMQGRTISIDYRREYDHIKDRGLRNRLADSKGFSCGDVTHWMPLPPPPQNT